MKEKELMEKAFECICLSYDNGKKEGRREAFGEVARFLDANKDIDIQMLIGRVILMEADEMRDARRIGGENEL